MRAWYSFFDMMQFPLKVLFFAGILLGIGEALANPTFAAMLALGEGALVLSAGLRYVGSFIFNNLPLLIALNMAGRRQDSFVPVISAALGYISFVIAGALTASQSFAAEFYISVLGININLREFSFSSKLSRKSISRYE
jgi:phosphotransferase system  glucose/maltose/N-acetylglucosamine-specific IIC component